MIGPSGAVKVMIATKPVDFRKGAEGLAALVKAEMGADPFSGTIYVFRAKRTDRIKLIFWDGSGVCLVAKRLEDGEFHWPRMQDGAMHLTAAQFSALFEGLDWKRVHAVGGRYRQRGLGRSYRVLPNTVVRGRACGD
ncbi:IS66 family insertion sequence element accessory protein TnpB [Agrobacterium sp. a22-2]|nr:IS66 family insertion sequence element accessory protein TnpB [Agrobacterium sp. a22-2]